MVQADIIVARTFADLATVSIVQHRTATEAQRLNEQLSAGLTSRVVIEQAKGVIAERAGIDLAETFPPVAALRPQPQPPPHRCRRSRHRRQPGSAGMGPGAPFGPSDGVGLPAGDVDGVLARLRR
jgi:hypothetical protein